MKSGGDRPATVSEHIAKPVKQENDYVSGAHDFWIHFWCGLVFGTLIGLWIGWELFNKGWPVVVTAVVVALAVAYSYGRWGDRTWVWIIKHLGAISP